MEAEAAQAVADPWHSNAAQEEEDPEHDQKEAKKNISFFLVAFSLPVIYTKLVRF